MKNIVAAIFVGGCLLLALVATGWTTVSDALGARGTWQPALELSARMPRCWSPGFLAYCRVDYSVPREVGSPVHSLHYLSLAPLANRALLLRSNTVPGHLTAAGALDRTRERLAIFAILLAALVLTTWRVVRALAREIQPSTDFADRLEKGGWRAAPAHPDTAPVSSSGSRQAQGGGFGRRH